MEGINKGKIYTDDGTTYSFVIEGKRMSVYELYNGEEYLEYILTKQ